MAVWRQEGRTQTVKNWPPRSSGASSGDNKQHQAHGWTVSERHCSGGRARLTVCPGVNAVPNTSECWPDPRNHIQCRPRGFHWKPAGLPAPRSKSYFEVACPSVTSADALTLKCESGTNANEASEYSLLLLDHLTTFNRKSKCTDAFLIELYEANSMEMHLKYNFIRLHSDLCMIMKYVNNSMMRAWRTGHKTSCWVIQY